MFQFYYRLLCFTILIRSPVSRALLQLNLINLTTTNTSIQHLHICRMVERLITLKCSKMLLHFVSFTLACVCAHIHILGIPVFDNVAISSQSHSNYINTLFVFITSSFVRLSVFGRFFSAILSCLLLSRVLKFQNNNKFASVYANTHTH